MAIDNLDLAILHAGGSGASVCQCREAVIRTKKAVPMQVDGEPCLMRPCTIRLSMDQGCAKVAKMLARNKNATCKPSSTSSRPLLPSPTPHLVELQRSCCCWLTSSTCFNYPRRLQMLSETTRSRTGRPKRSKIASKSTSPKNPGVGHHSKTVIQSLEPVTISNLHLTFFFLGKKETFVLIF